MRETRYWKAPAPLELRAGAGKVPTIVGYGAVFNRYSQNLGGFVEVIDPAAFNDTLSRKQDFKSYWNHDPSRALGRTTAGNLTVEADGTGLGYEVAPPDTSYARDLAAVVEAGIVQGSSFTFRVLPDGVEWTLTEQGFPLRRLLAVELYELGPVSDPAYLDTETEGVSVALRSLAVQCGRRPEEVLEAAGANELRSIIEAIDLDPGPAQPASRREVNRRRLALAARVR